MNHEQVMRQALEALEFIDQALPWPAGKHAKDAITALRAALVEYDDEPTYCPTCGEEDGGTTCGIPDCALRVGEEPQTESITDAMMNLVDRLGSEYDQVDPRAWQHLLVYAPKTEPVQEPVARFNWNEGKFEWLTKYDYYKHHMKPLYLHPAPAVPEVKAHQIRELVNQLRDIAIKYHDHQSLRDRLAGPVHDLWLLSIKREQKE